MPYIKQLDRKKFDYSLSQIPNIKTKGELEYILFYALLKYMEGKEWKYSTLHDATYAAQHVADEFRRRYLDVRENQAMDSNGDIVLIEPNKDLYAKEN